MDELMLQKHSITEGEIDCDIAGAEADYQQEGVLLDAEKAMLTLRNKHFGKTSKKQT